MKEKILKWGLHILPCLAGLLGGWQHMGREQRPSQAQTHFVAPSSDHLPRYLTFYQPPASDTPQTGSVEDGINTDLPFRSLSAFPFFRLTPFLFSQNLLRDPLLLR